MDPFGLKPNFESLSVEDLLTARELYHFHLMNKSNVVGTAIGRYLIRTSDPWPRKKGEGSGSSNVRSPKEERRFDNSEVRDYSWPCLLVMVDQWVDEDQFGTGHGQYRPENIVPKILYLPNGKMVPVCVVRVQRSNAPGLSTSRWHWPDTKIGGGFPVIVDHQGVERIASIGCLVTDGHTTYALTNRHVCGDKGLPVDTIQSGIRKRIGAASGVSLSRLKFTEVYPSYPGTRTYSTLDVGLIELDDLNNWTSSIYGIGAVGELGDLHEANITLRVIDQQVVAFGAASGRMTGRIKALFYRHKAIGGYDYVSDFLIAPEDPQQPQTRPGDSGTIWHLNPDNSGDLRPLAIEWGGFQSAGRDGQPEFRFALATSLSSVCQLLDVELVRDHETTALPFWGRTGHYSIASFAADALTSSKLKTLIDANLGQISFAKDSLDPATINDALKEAAKADDFTPLADVPDEVWKKLPHQRTGGRDKPGGKNGRTTGPEHPTHYADVDAVGADGKTLLELSLADDGRNFSLELWRDFYTKAGMTEQHARGLLPFRVWQIFDQMKSAVKQRDIARFVCAAGILSHYVGDASQPLHGSVLSDGYKDRPKTVTHVKRDTGEEYPEDTHVGAGVHSAYETKMIDRYATTIVASLPAAVRGIPKESKVAKTGREAALLVLELMRRTSDRLPPADIVDTYIAEGDTPTVAVQDAIWSKFGDATIETMADGAQLLAHLWFSAWTTGDGERLPMSSLKQVPTSNLMQLYQDPQFLESHDLDSILLSST